MLLDLYHEKRFDDDIGKINREIMQKTKEENKFFIEKWNTKKG